MPLSKTFHVMTGRFFFICPSCRNKKMITVGYRFRRTSVRCPKCRSKITCVLNRRLVARSSQSGRVFLLVSGSQTEVELVDISTVGVGFEMDVRSALKIAIARVIEFNCSWTRGLFRNGRYVVRFVKGGRAGAQYRG
jgi:hypothetical protein